jgi:cytochrome c-type biogenesis protein CcmE
MRRPVKVGIALAVVAGALVLLLFAGFHSGATYYLEISEVKGRSAEVAGQRVRIAGTVLPGSIVWQPQTFTLTFALTDGRDTVQVAYKGVRPDTFGDNSPVIAEGRVDADGSLLADKLLMQCPSKYEARAADVGGEHPATTAKPTDILSGGTP